MVKLVMMTNKKRTSRDASSDCATLLTFNSYMPMKLLSAALLSSALLFSAALTTAGGDSPVSSNSTPTIFGFRDAAAESAVEARFLAVPDPKLAEQHLRILTQAPHMAGTV